RPNRLVIYAVICSMLSLLAVAGGWYWVASRSWDIQVANNAGSFSFQSPQPTPLSLSERWGIAIHAWDEFRGLRALLVYAGLWLLWPWLTLMSLSLFQI